MANERKTERLVREALLAHGYFADALITVEEQRSDNPRIQKLLKSASKAGKGSHIIWFLRALAHMAQRLATAC